MESSVDVAEALRQLVTQRAQNRRPSSAQPVLHRSEFVPEHGEENREDWSSRIPPVQHLEHSLPFFEHMEERLDALSDQRISSYKVIEREVLDRRNTAELLQVKYREAEARCAAAERRLEQFRQNERRLKATQEEMRVLWMYVEQAKEENRGLRETLEAKDQQIEALQAELERGFEREQAISGMPKVFRQDKRTAVIKQNIAGQKMGDEAPDTSRVRKKKSPSKRNMKAPQLAQIEAFEKVIRMEEDAWTWRFESTCDQ
ncbi:unnamed protein product [Durusdinium trenchii]|uniref:Uncharacterized protein n=1 Tax=Durusdinium trenchii TaxID=1381693 RepID=A0ABP0M1X5_9DINO